MILLLGCLFVAITLAVNNITTINFILKEYFSAADFNSSYDVINNFLVDASQLLTDWTYISKNFMDELSFYDKCPFQKQIFNSLNKRYNLFDYSCFI